jgi:hypothetical protein
LKEVSTVCLLICNFPNLQHHFARAIWTFARSIHTLLQGFRLFPTYTMRAVDVR